MQTHLRSRTLKGAKGLDKDVQVRFAVQPDRKAVLFIHGFTGDAITTWSDFHLLLPECAKCRGRDLYFYGYDGLRVDIEASASIFRGVLNQLFGARKEFFAANLPKSMPRADDFGYDELIIVAHSLGAVIARRTLLDATRVKAPWTRGIKLVLYAPAHMGANVAKLALEVASSFSWLSVFGAFARFKSPLIEQLTPKSDALTKLKEDTEKARAGGANPHLVAQRVIIAHRDEILLKNETFADDPPPEPAIIGTSHTSVCKPRADFREALEHLEACL